MHRNKKEENFHITVIKLCEKTKSATSYNPRKFKSKALRIGAYRYAQEILDSNDDNWEGFTQLFINHRLDLSLEALVLDENWQSLFTRNQLETAQRRLKSVDYKHIPDLLETPSVQGAVSEPKRREYTLNSVVRDYKIAKFVKELYDYECQICRTKLTGIDFKYAEAAHIRPLGSPHNGKDDLSNILCLCPNHHKLFDLGGIFIEDDFSITGLDSKLYINKEHQIDTSNFQYHRNWFLESA
ncbi:HNH endonuclease [Thalassotalea sp. G20_0]|uniref:HNH endonuclease n=1 Tax=Thalassotalea sp. G20_0 TaxID=2821093 RepID=UPI001ADC2A0A|nr:HNH endonuclease [Thalassotalea sp. G20_0]MBO9497296.1 HNH endonuclease [Thalassotalea sp. G20_0]